MEKKFCPKCQYEGWKSKVFIMNKSFSDELGKIQGYYNEEGDYCECSTAVYGINYIYYQCSFGHKWAESDYLGEEIIFL